MIPYNKLSIAAKSHLNKTTTALADSNIEWFLYGSADLLNNRRQRCLDAENHIIALALTCNFAPTRNIVNNTWATDGSMMPAASSISQSKSVTAAVSGPASIIMRLAHRNASILHGEQLALVSALVLAEQSPLIYTDHLNSTMLIDDSRTAINLDRRLHSMNGRSYYRWILDLVSQKSATITYTKAHTNDLSLAAALNREADHYASTSQKHISSIPVAPIPTSFMNSYTFHREPDGWIESNVRYFIDHFLAKASADSLALLPNHRMATWLYDTNSPPPWVYMKAPSAYTALVQIYARSGQLPTADGMYKKNSTASSICRFSCPDTETPHHIFVVCDRFSHLRQNELTSLTSSLTNRMIDANVDTADQTQLLFLANSLFSDSDIFWPLYSSAFFLGQIPKIEPHLPPLSVIGFVHRSRLIQNIASDLHLSSVRLTSRIFGDLQKVMSERHLATSGNR